MAKKVIGFIKLQIPAGKANPAPPVGPALGQHGVNIMEFCKAFNAKTQEKMGKIIPVEISVFADRSFSFITKTPPASSLILRFLDVREGTRLRGLSLGLSALRPWSTRLPSFQERLRLRRSR